MCVCKDVKMTIKKDVNDVDLKEIEGHKSQKVSKTLITSVAIQTIKLKWIYGKIWKESEGDAID